MKRQALDSDPLRGLRHDFKGARLDDNHEISLSMSSISTTQPLNLIPTTLSPSMHDVGNAQEQLAQRQHLYHQTYSQAPIQPSLLSNGHDGLPRSQAVTSGLGSQIAKERQQRQQRAQLVVKDMMGDSPMMQEYLEGFPSPALFDNLLNEYILSLSPKKRDKALIPQKRYDNILSVLKDPKCTTIESAQFRFWAKKMFSLGSGADKANVVCHEEKPVAVRENLYQVLMTAHGACQHGGRDKTSAQVRKYYSWVPKELIARFVRNCPTCAMRRNPMGYDLSHAVARQSHYTQARARIAPPAVSIPTTTAARPTSVLAIASASPIVSPARTSPQAVKLIGTTGISPLHPHRAIATPRTATTMALSNSAVVTTAPNVIAVPAVLMPTTSATAGAATTATTFPFQVSQIMGVSALSGGLHNGGFHIDPRMYAVTGAE